MMFFFMGMAYEHMNDDAMALRYIQKAIAKNPSRLDYKVKENKCTFENEHDGRGKRGSGGIAAE